MIDDLKKALNGEFTAVDMSQGSTRKGEVLWECKIGVIGKVHLPPGADSPMRRGIERAFREVTGQDAQFIFSGWGAKLTELERKIVKR